MPHKTRKAETQKLGALNTRAAFQPGSVDTEARTATFVASTGSKGLRRSFWSDDYYESLEVSESAIRMDRLNRGAPFLKDHNAYSIDNQVGVIERAWVESEQLMIEVRFANDEDGDKIFQRVADGILKNVSVGYRVYSYEKTVREGELDELRATDWEPVEVSLVTVPFDSGAQVRSADDSVHDVTIYTNRAAVPETTEEALIMSTENQTAPKANADKGQENRAIEPAVTAGDVATAARQAANEATAAERSRVSGINKAVKAAGLGDDLARSLIDDGVSIDEARSQVIDKLAEQEPAPTNSRQFGDFVVGMNGADEVRSGIADTIMQRIDPTHQGGEHADAFRGMTMMELGRRVLELNGSSTNGMSRMELASRAMSTGDLQFVLADVANKTLLRGYNEVPRTFTELGRRETITDFKPVNRVRVGSFSDLLPKTEGGEFKHGIVKDENESYALATYGRTISFTREMMINDDMSALSRMTSLFGAAAARLESQLVWGHILGNPTMGDGKQLFHADHGNLAAAGAAISTATISAARQAMRKQKDNQGNLIEVMPSYLVCGPDKETEAEQFLSGTLRPTKTTDVVPERMRSSLDLIVENRIPGNQWYMMASPSMIDTFEYAYLAGQEGVYIESEPQFLSGDMKWGVRHDFAAKAIDWKGMHKNEGEA